MNKTISLLWRKMTHMLDVGLRSTIAKNAASLYIIQFASYILPLIMIPYLVRVLNPSGYGLVAFGQGLIAYFTIFVDYGFTYSATRKISLQRENILAISSTAFNVWATKALLGFMGLIVLLLAVIIIPKFHETFILFLILYGIVIGNVLFPTWLFQGMEKMVAISLINLLMQILILVGVFTIVHRPEDYILYAGIISIGSIFSGIIGVSIAFIMFKLQLILPSKGSILETLREGWMLFISTASISLYTAGNAFILGLLTNNAVVGYYSVAEKIVNAASGLLGPISQAAYPKFSRLASISKALTLQWGRKMLAVLGGLGLILSIMLFIGAPYIVQILLGSEYEPSIMVIRILSALPFLIAISNVLGVQLAFPFKLEKAIFTFVFMAGCINILLAIILAPRWGADGMAMSVLASEIFITLSYFIYLLSKNLNPLQKISED